MQFGLLDLVVHASACGCRCCKLIWRCLVWAQTIFAWEILGANLPHVSTQESLRPFYWLRSSQSVAWLINANRQAEKWKKLPVFSSLVWHGRGSNPSFPHPEGRSNHSATVPLCHSLHPKFHPFRSTTICFQHIGYFKTFPIDAHVKISKCHTF